MAFLRILCQKSYWKAWVHRLPTSCPINPRASLVEWRFQTDYWRSTRSCAFNKPVEEVFCKQRNDGSLYAHRQKLWHCKWIYADDFSQLWHFNDIVNPNCRDKIKRVGSCWSVGITGPAGFFLICERELRWVTNTSFQVQFRNLIVFTSTHKQLKLEEQLKMVFDRIRRCGAILFWVQSSGRFCKSRLFWSSVRGDVD